MSRRKCCYSKGGLEKVIGEPQTQTNRTQIVGVPGLSAYEEWKAHNPDSTWTEDEWLENYVKGEQGDTPYIGSNGNWWIGDEDLGVPAEGEPGENPYIGDNGNWWVGDVDTGVSASGGSVYESTQW